MAEGDIGTVIDSLEFDVANGSAPNIIHISGNVYAIAYEGPDIDGWLKTVTIADDGQIGDTAIDSLEFDEDTGKTPNIIHISGNVYAIAYYGTLADGWLKTVTIADDGQIGNTTIDSLEYDIEMGQTPNIIHVSGTVYVIAYAGYGNDGWLKTVTIADDGQIGDVVIDSLEFDNVFGFTPKIIHINEDVYAVAYSGVDINGWLKTVTIAYDGQIVDVVIDSLEFETGHCEDPDIIHISGNVYAIAYYGPDLDGWLKTVTIADDGQIGDTTVDSFEFDNVTGQAPVLIHISGNVYAIAYAGPGYTGWLKTVTIADDGQIGDTAIDSLEYDNVMGLAPDLIYISGSIYVIAYTGNESDGWLKTMTIETIITPIERAHHLMLMGLGV